jgi:hypothetical protein
VVGCLRINPFGGVRELAIHRRVSRLRYSRRCVEASAVQAHLRQGISLAPGMEIGYVVRDTRKWEADPERTASGFDAGYYGKLLGKAWVEAAFVFREGASRQERSRDSRSETPEYRVWSQDYLFPDNPQSSRYGIIL